MDIDDLLNFINDDSKAKKSSNENQLPQEKDDNAQSKKKRKKKKNNIQNEDEKEKEKEPQKESTIHSDNSIKENKYRSLLNYEGIEITNSRQQDNSTLRLIGNWIDKEWSQTYI